MELKRTEDEIISLTTILHSIQHRQIEWNDCPTSSETIPNAATHTVVTPCPLVSSPLSSPTSPLPPSCLVEYYSSLVLSIPSTNDEKDDADGASLANALEVLRRAKDDERNGGGTETDDSIDGTEDGNEPIQNISAQELCTSLESIRDRVSIVKGSVTKFRDRLEKKDPITNLPRYGTKTASRLQSLLQLYDALSQVIHTVFTHPSTTTTPPPTMQSLLQNAITHQTQLLHSQTLQTQLVQQTQQQHLEKLAQTAETTRQLQEQADAIAQKKEREELAQRAEIARQLRLAAERDEVETERAEERAVVEGVLAGGKGVEGVKVQIRRLVGTHSSIDGGNGECNTTITVEERSKALVALHTLFSQIASHPEEIKYRRVRRDHPQFNEDIGRHEGGEGVLIAAGFRYGEVDGVKCLLSKEPDLERDMDGWSDWFDLMKKTVELIEEEMIR